MVRPGMHADFIAIDGDPLVDIHALGRVVSVVQAGQNSSRQAARHGGRDSGAR